MKKILIALLGVAFVGAMAMPAMAADKAEWNFYGSIRMETFSYDDDVQSPEAYGGKDGYDVFGDDRDTEWDLQGNTRVGAKVSAGDISGLVEFRETGEWRKIWGEWDFGVGKLGVGKDYTPVNMMWSWQTAYEDQNLLPTGSVYTGADGMVRLRFQGLANMIDLDFALVEPAFGHNNDWTEKNEEEDWDKVADWDEAYDVETTLPQIEARIAMNWGPIKAELQGGWVEYELARAVGGAERTYDVDGWIAAFGLQYAMGPFYASGNIHTGENNSLLGQWVYDAALPEFNPDTDSFVDKDRWGWSLVGGLKVNPLLTFEAGYGEAQVEADWTEGTTNPPDDEVAAYYLQARITPTKGLFIVPEIGKRDYKENFSGDDEGDTLYYGVHWRVNF